SQEYFSALCGQSRHLMFGGGGQQKPYCPVSDFMLEDCGTNVNYHEVLQPDVLPTEFGKLARGGPNYDFWVEMFCHQSGRKFKANRGRPWVKCAFRQRF